jgi:hypothetical protein
MFAGLSPCLSVNAMHKQQQMQQRPEKRQYNL